MTFDDRVRALTYLGLTPRQTAFVATVALHSGYCVRRQYAAFAGLAYGKNVREFLDDLVDRHLASRYLYELNRGHVYHLYARSLYRVIDQDENRNRRHASAAVIARKLMLLDFVIQQRDAEWIATEQDKVALFEERFAVPRRHHPQRFYAATDPSRPATTRYFIHKMPVYLAGDPAVPHFVFPVTEPTGHLFTQFLRDHAALLGRLSSWVVVAICPTHLPWLDACHTAFPRVVTASTPVSIWRPDELRAYFVTRRAVDEHDSAALSVASADRFHAARRKFAGLRFEQLYSEWLIGGDAVIRRGEEEQAVALRPSAGRLLTVSLPFSYSQFGVLPGVA